MSSLKWRKPSRSGANGDNCVEVATDRDRVLVRDSKDPDGPVLAVTAAEWRGFVSGLDRRS
jgi:hypothetical protein